MPGEILICRAVETARRRRGRGRGHLPPGSGARGGRAPGRQHPVARDVHPRGHVDPSQGLPGGRLRYGGLHRPGPHWARSTTRAAASPRAVSPTPFAANLAEAKGGPLQRPGPWWTASSSPACAASHTQSGRALAQRRDRRSRARAGGGERGRDAQPEQGGAWLMEALGRLDRSRGNLVDAAAKLRDAGRRFDALGITCPAVTGWPRPHAHPDGAGEDQTAQRLAADDLASRPSMGGATARDRPAPRGQRGGRGRRHRPVGESRWRSFEAAARPWSTPPRCTALGSAAGRERRAGGARFPWYRTRLRAPVRRHPARRAHPRGVGCHRRPGRGARCSGRARLPRRRESARWPGLHAGQVGIARSPRSSSSAARPVEPHVRHALHKLEVSSAARLRAPGPGRGRLAWVPPRRPRRAAIAAAPRSRSIARAWRRALPCPPPAAPASAPSGPSQERPCRRPAVWPRPMQRRRGAGAGSSPDPGLSP